MRLSPLEIDKGIACDTRRQQKSCSTDLAQGFNKYPRETTLSS